MNLPKKVKVGGVIYDIELIEKFEDDTLGEINYEKQLIRVRKGKPDYMNQTFIHELLHAMNIYMSEKEVEFLAVSLYQVIKDNPKLFNQEIQKEEVKKNVS